MTEQHAKRPQLESISHHSTSSWNIIREYSNLCSPEEMVRILIRRQIEHFENARTDRSLSNEISMMDHSKILSKKEPEKLPYVQKGVRDS